MGAGARTVVTLAVVLTLTPFGTAPAGALTPPLIDDSRLPPAAPPGPREPTVQRRTCVAPVDAAPDRRNPGSSGLPPQMWPLETLWKLSRGAGQQVAVIDTGVAPHPRLARLEAGGDYVSAGDGTADCDGHGTVVAGLIAAAPDGADPTGFAGVAPDVTVLGIRQSSTHFSAVSDPNGTGYGDVDTMAAAVRTAADRGATVINISTVACTTGALEDRTLGAALAYAVDVRDAVVVVAAGNVGGAGRCPRPPDGSARDWATTTVAVSPAWYDDLVLAVGSAGPDGAASPFTLPGPWVDVAAPGESLISLNARGAGVVAALPTETGSTPISGTSYAAPLVSGLAALVRARFPELTARQVMQRIESTAQRAAHGWDPLVGNGLVDPVAALDSQPPATPATPVRTAAPEPADSRPEPPAGSSPPRPGRTLALFGTAGCALAVAVTLTRWRRPRHDVPGD